jgi:drug/metabolite transporter, DME family
MSGVVTADRCSIHTNHLVTGHNHRVTAPSTRSEVRGGPVTSHRQHTVLVASLMALAAGMVWSFGGLTARLAKHTDAWQYLVWRSVGVFVVMELLNARKRRAPLTGTAFGAGRRMIFACAALMLASVCFVYAIKNTSAANAALLSSITPLLAAVLGRIFIGEMLSRITIVAIGVAFVGLVVMVTGTGASSGTNTIAGNVAAMVSALGFASYTVTIRSSSDRDWGPVLPGYAILTVVLCGAITVANGNPLFPSVHDVGLAVLHGGVFIVVGTLLFNAGSRQVPAAAMAVFSQTETVFVPIWVFIGIGERPAITTLVGGAIIMTAVVGKALLERR